MERPDRALPTFITLIVLAVLFMTFDVRAQGEGVAAVIRGGAQTIMAPLQRAATVVVDPVADFLNGLSDITSLRETNDALKAELAQAQAKLAEADDDLARLKVLERLYDLNLQDTQVAQIPANVIGRADQFDLAFQIDKGVDDGVIDGQPVIDVNGFVVGTVETASPNTAIVVPITASRNQVTVLVGSETGLLKSKPGSSDMTLEIFDARDPVAEGDQVVTAANTFPSGLPVGEVLQAASPEASQLTTTVRPFVDPENLRVVVVLAWPPDPTRLTTTTTTVPTTDTTEGPPVDTAAGGGG
ncbi:MAG: rod shape-determining protein MreC [Acidimicrobiia bacterium]